MVPPLFATGRFGQLTAVAGAAAGARHTLPALPADPQTRPVGQRSPEAQAGRPNSPVDSWMQLLPAAQPDPPEQNEVQTPPGKSALSTQVSRLAQLGVQLAEPTWGTVPVHAEASASTTRRHGRGIRTRATASVAGRPPPRAQGACRTEAPRGAPH